MDVDLSTNLDQLPAARRAAPLRAQRGLDRNAARPPAHVRRRIKREVLSRGYNLLVHAGFRAGFSDAQCGFKALRADVARLLVPLVDDDGWFFDTELLLLAERNGMRIHEVPVDWVEDLDSPRRPRCPTIAADLAGLWRVRRAFWRGEAREPDAGRAPWRGDATDGGGAGSPMPDGHRAELVHDGAARPAAACGQAASRCRSAVILALAACLDFWSLTQNGYANTYYAGAVRSMLRELAQLLLRLVRPGRPRLGRQAAARALAPGGEREGLRLLVLLDPAPRGARGRRRGRGSSTCSSPATSAAWPASSPRWRSPSRPSPSRSTATTTRTRCSRCCSSRPSTSARGRSSRDGCAGSLGCGRARRARVQHEDARRDGRRARASRSRTSCFAPPRAGGRAPGTSLVGRRRARRRLGRVDRRRRPDARRRPAVRRLAPRTTARSASPSTTTASAASPARPAARRSAAASAARSPARPASSG